MKPQPINVVGGSYCDVDRHYSVQDTVNYIPETAQAADTRAPTILRGAPGFGAPKITLGTGPIRGGVDVEGVAYVVSGTELYRCVPSGGGYVATALGVIPNNGRCQLTFNQIAGGHQILIANGPTGYIYNDVTNVFVQITDPGYPGSFVAEFIDTYFAQLAPDGTYWYISSLLDGTNYSTLDRFTLEANPCKIVSLIANHEEIWALGEKVIQPFYNAGAQDITFQPLQGTLIEQGCAAAQSVMVEDNSVFWLGDDGIIYRANGYTPVRISTHPIEEALVGLDWGACYAFVFTQRGHKIIYWTFPDGMTWGYDCATSLWHRRQSYGLNRWRIAMLIFSGGVWLAGDYENGNLYALDWNATEENGQPLIADRVCGYVQDAQNPMTANQIELVMDTGKGGLHGDNTVMMRYSDDGGSTWKNWKYKSMGKVGQYGKRIRFQRLGQFLARIFHFRVTSPVSRDLIACYAQMEQDNA